jgi:type II secretory pathway component GspD/PulD (secretin)
MDGPISKEHRSLNPVASCTAMPFETSKANAALIVAAVNACFKVNPSNPLAVAEGMAELVEACRNIAKLFDEAKEQGYSISAASNSWADALGAALAKLEAK